jgi:hypothetical protein
MTAPTYPCPRCGQALPTKRSPAFCLACGWESADHPMARSSDPRTSHQAAAHMSASGSARGQRERIFDWIAADASRNWLTREEMIAAGAPYDGYQLARRLPELREEGRLVNGAARVSRLPAGARASNRKQITWGVADDQAALL